MAAMKSRHALLLVCGLLVFASLAQAKTILPDACGDDGVKFDVKTEKGQPAPAGPEAGKARIVFVESVDKSQIGTCIGCDIVTRVGVDGAWVGANKGVSYFIYDVEPGERQVCVNWQSIRRSTDKDIGIASFSAEPGNVYYFLAKITLEPFRSDRATQKPDHLDLTKLSEDEGKYLVKISAVSASAEKK
jgi:hypothetical protein